MAKKKKMSPAQVLKLMVGTTGVPKLGEVTEEIIQAFGGPKRFSRKFQEEFAAARPGSQVRARMLEAILRLLTLQRGERDESSLDLVDEEDLKSTAQELLGAAEDEPDE